MGKNLEIHVLTHEIQFLNELIELYTLLFVVRVEFTFQTLMNCYKNHSQIFTRMSISALSKFVTQLYNISIGQRHTVR